MNFVEEFINSVLIIDDKPEEINELQEELEKHDVWVTHYLPDDIKAKSPIRHRTLLFLDLHLSENEKIESILSKYTRPILQKHFSGNYAYGIVIWSLHDDEISIFFEKIIEDTVNNHKYTAPVFIINLEKSKYIQSKDYSGIVDDLNNRLVKSPVASFFMTWAISVTKSLSAVVSDFFSLTPDFADKENKMIKNLYLLAKNYAGLPENQLTDYPLYQDAYKAFDELIYSSLLSQSKKYFIRIFDEYNPVDETDFTKIMLDFANINEKMLIDHILDIDQGYVLPGSVYEVIGNDDYLSVPQKPKKGHDIAIELTPPCDFSHKKLNSKLIGGFIVELPNKKEKVDEYINKTFKADSKYLIWPVFATGDKPKLICFDFRCISIVKDSDLKDPNKYKLIFRTKHSLFADILQKFSSHSARLGVACMQPELKL